ncbi:unnamed protein product [Gongylonema pulchrum]|uniref:Transposase n=1 Tax=Gongylonema pulchrum TaxID=637853 RepID=A0A183EBT3_9BILA|nr:unnamed protein product [Gongylonema pulchrum]
MPEPTASRGGQIGKAHFRQLNNVHWIVGAIVRAFFRAVVLERAAATLRYDLQNAGLLCCCITKTPTDRDDSL